MNTEERIEFFNQIKGKKIRWSKWDKGDYCIPNEHLNDLEFYATLIFDDKESEVTCGYGNGFNPSTNSGGFWIFFEEETVILKEKRKCNCDSWNLFNFGCKCGGV